MSGADEMREVQTLRKLVQTFVRDFGLVAENATPCGQAVPLSYAHALMILLQAGSDGSSMSQAQLSQELGIDKSNVTRLCARMEEAGHVEQCRSQEDGRSRLVALTKRGRPLALQIDRSSRQRFARLFAAIPATQRHAVLRSLESLTIAVAALRTSEEDT